jgi:hypothetical protein
LNDFAVSKLIVAIGTKFVVPRASITNISSIPSVNPLLYGTSSVSIPAIKY